MGKVSDIRSEPRSDTICLEGNGYRPSHHGDGWIVSKVMYTLNSTEVHCVCYERKERATTVIVSKDEQEDNADGKEIL